ncbi:hypothetical protein [Fodinicola feengrottensis]|uniref:DksA C4-type domain-containing protein n=1 Tax=Fodinicola feengrottensis TaxID=435914 RepID=A0ABP4UDM0_9ACTN|nr:hypothetical protein [Fodinicola feengrottensis]
MTATQHTATDEEVRCEVTSRTEIRDLPVLEDGKTYCVSCGQDIEC